MIRGKSIAEMPSEQGERLRTGLSTLEMLRLLGDTAHKLIVQAEALGAYMETMPEGIANDRTAAFLAMLVRQQVTTIGPQSDELMRLMGHKRDLAKVPAPDGHVFTVRTRSGEYPISFRASNDEKAEGEAWSAIDLRRMIGGGYSFVSDLLRVDPDISGIVAPIFAHAGDMRCLVGGTAVVDVVPVRNQPRGNSHVVNEMIS